MNVVNEIEKIINEAERMRSSYFYNPPKCAGMRRSYEKYHSHDEISWEENGHSYTAKFSVQCSCRNVYAYGEYTKDGKKTTLTTIKNSYKRLKGEA